MTKNLVTLNKNLLFIKKRLAISISKIFLNFLLFALGILLLRKLLDVLHKGIEMKMCLEVIAVLIFFLTIYNLRKIVYCINSTPFCLKNVKRFKWIGYYMFFMAVIDGIAKYKSPSYSGIEIFASHSGSLKESFLIYIILAFIALVLSEIFEKAVEIKDENDLTI